VTSAAVSEHDRAQDAFRHEALFYAGPDEFLNGTLGFIQEGLREREPMLVVVDAAKIESLRDALGADAGAVCFADMAEVGHNPALIIPAWRAFVDEHGPTGRRLRGIGEPIGPARTVDELVECQRHETLLNVAFDGTPAWWLMCPYDVSVLSPDVIDEAYRSHPFIAQDGIRRSSNLYRLPADMLGGSLPAPPENSAEIAFRTGDLGAVRAFVNGQAEAVGLDGSRIGDLALAITELATNSIRHGRGGGTLRVWRDGSMLVAEVRDAGRILEPLVGREPPSMLAEGGRGLWLVNHLCDLVQVRSVLSGTSVRIHLAVHAQARV